jgi:hypothetical protein
MSMEKCPNNIGYFDPKVKVKFLNTGSLYTDDGTGKG